MYNPLYHLFAYFSFASSYDNNFAILSIKRIKRSFTLPLFKKWSLTPFKTWLQTGSKVLASPPKANHTTPTLCRSLYSSLKNTFFCFPSFKFAARSPCNVIFLSLDFMLRNTFYPLRLSSNFFFYRCLPEKYNYSPFCVPIVLWTHLYSSTGHAVLHSRVCFESYWFNGELLKSTIFY